MKWEMQMEDKSNEGHCWKQHAILQKHQPSDQPRTDNEENDRGQQQKIQWQGR